jgi:hypothetical protein
VAAIVPWLTILATTLAAGCAELSYSGIRLGQEQREYQQAFPEDRTRRTPTGICYLEKDPLGRTDAMVLLLTADRRVAGKLHATHFERNYGFKVETGYRLVGELDPAMLRLSSTGPIDALRAVADELTATEADAFARQTQAWVAAGLVRLVQHWPHVGDEGPAFTRLTSVLERVLGGGLARITVDPRGVYLLEYTQGAVR